MLMKNQVSAWTLHFPLEMKIHAPLTNDLTHGATPGIQDVEVATFLQIPGLQIIGLPGPEVAEARDRIRSAIESVRLELPRRRVVVNLSPAYLKKRGTGLDLAMALAILFEKKDTLPVAAWGELGLDGSVKPAGQMVRVIYAVWKNGIRYLVLAQDDFQAGLEALNQVREGESFEF
jgi:magnesium chelatase family protein